MIADKNKQITNITYNYLYLPLRITMVDGDSEAIYSIDHIDYVYDATGVKQSKKISNPLFGTSFTTDYAAGYIYEKPTSAGSISMKFFSHPEGYASKNANGTFSYIYQYRTERKKMSSGHF